MSNRILNLIWGLVFAGNWAVAELSTGQGRRVLSQSQDRENVDRRFRANHRTGKTASVLFPWVQFGIFEFSRRDTIERDEYDQAKSHGLHEETKEFSIECA